MPKRSCLKKVVVTLTGVAQGVGGPPVNLKVAGLVSGQDTRSPSLPLSVKINK